MEFIAVVVTLLGLMSTVDRCKPSTLITKE